MVLNKHISTTAKDAKRDLLLNTGAIYIHGWTMRLVISIGPIRAYPYRRNMSTLILSYVVSFISVLFTIHT